MQKDTYSNSEFTNDRKQLLLTMGETGVPGNDEKHFARPTDTAWLPHGTFFVTDGHVNTRVLKFDRNAKFLMTWGTKGDGPGQFNLPHSVDIDRNRRIYVADRANGGRFQKYRPKSGSDPQKLIGIPLPPDLVQMQR